MNIHALSICIKLISFQYYFNSKRSNAKYCVILNQFGNVCKI